MLRLMIAIVLAGRFMPTLAADPATPPPDARVAPLPEVKVGDWWLPKNRPGKVVVTGVSDGRITMRRGDGKDVVYTPELNTLEA